MNHAKEGDSVLGGRQGKRVFGISKASWDERQVSRDLNKQASLVLRREAQSVPMALQQLGGGYGLNDVSTLQKIFFK